MKLNAVDTEGDVKYVHRQMRKLAAVPGSHSEEPKLTKEDIFKAFSESGMDSVPVQEMLFRLYDADKDGVLGVADVMQTLSTLTQGDKQDIMGGTK